MVEHGFVVMAESCAEDSGFAIFVRPHNRLVFFAVFAVCGGEDFALRPTFSITYSSPFGVSHFDGKPFMIGWSLAFRVTFNLRPPFSCRRDVTPRNFRHSSV